MENMDKLHVAGLHKEELAQLMAEQGWPRFRADQVFRWVHQKASSSFEEMHNLPQEVVEHLEEKYRTPSACWIILTRESQDGTIKYLFELFDHSTIEAVYIPEPGRGHYASPRRWGAMNCSFCATGRSGFVRNLRAEIVSQVNAVRGRCPRCARSDEHRVHGMGEPFANFTEVMAAAVMQDKAGMNLGQRRITISTCGLVPEILQFADLNTQINLAVSLHAPDNARRSQVMPINRRYPIEELLEACRVYTAKTNRRISFEYALMAGFNDAPHDAHMLAGLLRDMLCHVNLIPVNPVEGFQRPRGDEVKLFKEILERQGIPASIRKERGTDIEAACGQLRQVHKGERRRGE